MSEKIVQLNEEVIKGEIKELVRGNIDTTRQGICLAGVQTNPRGVQNGPGGCMVAKQPIFAK